MLCFDVSQTCCLIAKRSKLAIRDQAKKRKHSECVCFENKGGWNMAIYGFRDMNIHVVCLVGWMG